MGVQEYCYDSDIKTRSVKGKYSLVGVGGGGY